LPEKTGATLSSPVIYLESLVCRHGPPLVLKSDKGSSFKSDDTRQLLERWNVLPLFCPPRTPQYNTGAMKPRSRCREVLE
jgi:hypothetical protein